MCNCTFVLTFRVVTVLFNVLYVGASPLKGVIEVYCICSDLIHSKISTIMDGIFVWETSGLFSSKENGCNSFPLFWLVYCCQ